MTGAARILHVTQPAVTRLVKDLEAELGLKLFERQGTGLRPNQSALELFSDVEDHVASVRRIAETADRIRDRKINRLRVAAMTTLSAGALPHAIRNFRKKEPDTDFFIHSDSSFRILEAVSRNEFDIGFAIVPPERIDIDHLPMPTTSAICLVPRLHPLAQKPVIEVGDLDHQPFISLGTSSLLRLKLEAAMRQSGVRPSSTIQTLYSNTVSSYVASNLGLAVADLFSIQGADLSAIAVKRFVPEIAFDFSAVFPRQRLRLAVEFARAMHNEAEACLQASNEFSPHS